MNRNSISLPLVLIVLFGAAQASPSSLELLARFGPIETVEAIVDPLCSCQCRSLKIQDSAGNKLSVSLGYSEESPHSGFWVGSTNPASQDAAPVQIESKLEKRLVELFSAFVETKFPELRSMRDTGSRPIGHWATEERVAVYVLDTLAQLESQEAFRRSLLTRFSQVELDAIFALEYSSLDLAGRKVYSEICRMYGGCPFESASDLFKNSSREGKISGGCG